MTFQERLRAGQKRLTAGLLCTALWNAAVVLPARAEDEAAPRLGPARAQLLRSLFQGETVVPLEVTDRETDLTQPLRLDEAVTLALQNNFEIKAAAAKTDAADWGVIDAYAAFLPTVTYSYSSGRERSGPADYNDKNDNRVLDSKHHRRDKMLSLTQPIISPSLIAEALVRHKSQTAAEIEETSARERIAMSTVTAYLQLLSGRLLIRFAEEYRDQLDKLNDLMKNRVEGGGAAQADLDRIKARSAAAQGAIIETRASFSAALDEFRRLTGVTPLSLKLPASLMPEQPETVENALVRALRQNPDYLLSAKQIEVQLAERDKALSRLLPKLSFEFTRTRTWNAGGAALGTTSNGNEVYPYDNEQRAMLVTSWTLNGGTDLTAGMMANAKAREANFKSMDTRSRIEQLVRTSYNALGAARGRVPVLEQATDSSAKVITAFEEQYLNANRPLFDLLDAYERSYASRSDLARVVLSESQAAHTLYQQMGELVMALKQSENRIQDEPEAKPEPKPEPQPEAKAPSEPPLPEAAPRAEVQRERR